MSDEVFTKPEQETIDIAIDQPNQEKIQELDNLSQGLLLGNDNVNPAGPNQDLEENSRNPTSTNVADSSTNAPDSINDDTSPNKSVLMNDDDITSTNEQASTNGVDSTPTNEDPMNDPMSDVNHTPINEDSMNHVSINKPDSMNGFDTNGYDQTDASTTRKRNLESILQKEDGESETEDETMTDVELQEQDNIPIQEGFCVECRDQEASFLCQDCDENFCEVCFSMLHRTGNRRKHNGKSLKTSTLKVPQKKFAKPNLSANSSATDLSNTEDFSESGTENDIPKSTTIISSGSSTFGDWLEERCKYIPLRLNMDERKLLRLLEAALSVSEYTDKIDILSYQHKPKRIIHQIKDLCAILSGLLLASDYKKGQELFANKAFEANEEWFKEIFEVGRRHKIMNPEKMRDVYGKLMYMLMDSVTEDVHDALSFGLIAPIKTVYKFLEQGNGLGVLHDERVATATKEIIPDGKSRMQIQREIKEKERAIEYLSRNYANRDLLPEQIKQCLYSIGDNHAYLRGNRDCCDRMLQYLTTYFNPHKAETGYSLAIRQGSHGARLSHNHEIQYYYANQTLSLWREIQNEMFMLWSLADSDLLSGNNTYRLRDTGQGLNRVQGCPHVSKVMHAILHRAQQKAGYWVGSSVIHLGDKNVPNALMFIDKYNQVSRILNPILICLDAIDPLTKNDEGIQRYIETTFGGVEKLKKDILADFFRYAFDGSGADNFFDAGSCIDGRLTSAWNWCSQIEKKYYFPVFLLTGFVGFDGGDF